MAHFFGIMQGNKEEAAQGERNVGLKATLAGQNGAVNISLFIDEKGRDCCYISLRPWQGEGTSKVLYSGLVNPELEGKIGFEKGKEKR